MIKELEVPDDALQKVRMRLLPLLEWVMEVEA